MDFTKSKLLHFFSILITVSMISLTACQEEETDVVDDETQTAFETSKDTETAEIQFYDAYNTALDGLDGEVDGSRSGRTEGCAVITHFQETKIVMIDFGTSCVGQDGRTRSGKIIVNYRDRDRMTRDDLTITFENYKVNDYGLNGTLRTAGFSRNTVGQWQYNLQLENGTISFPDRDIQLAFERLYTWTEGFDSLSDYTDDVFMITGTSNGVTANGVTFTSTIQTPLTKKSVCLAQQIIYPVSGIIEIQFTSQDIPTVTLDYGNGACDKEATLRAGNQTRVITLP
ncbi:hypothetical protein WAF17_07940 [Bernardetia sp. ABR2-2B]|uniref:hypothetical protein n=1 Tax=Bernardetia sp. ABR2-2B TaxID=3127472 RepID=UPI0030CC687B